MRQKLIRGLLTFTVAVLCILTAYADDSFSCTTVDARGNVIHGYYDEEDAQWYLFLTNNVSIPDLTVELQGEVSSSDKGTVDQQTNTLSSAFSESGDSVTLQLVGGEAVTITVMQSALPSLYIELNGATLDDVHQDKNIKYTGTKVTLTDTGNSGNDLSVADATFKGRGNSSWAYYEKKGYQLKFDKKTSVLGMAKAKKWVLLANASDDSMMRNQLAFDLAEQLGMTVTPDSAYADLWINGDYRGTYLICEKVEIGSSRVDLNDPKGVLMEQDEAFYADEEIWISNEGTGRHFVLKESVTEDDPAVIEAAVQEFDEALNELMNYLTVTPNGDITLEALSNYIDVDSFLRYFLVNEYALNCESAVSSFYWYKDGPDDVLHLGPVWDFDTCMGNDKSTADSNQEYYIYIHTVYWKLLSAPAVQQALSKIYTDNFSLFAGAVQKTERIYGTIGCSAKMNYTRWNTLIGDVSGKGTYFANSYEEAVGNLQEWLTGRSKYFALSDIYHMHPISVSVDANAAKLIVHYQDGRQYEAVDFAVWSRENGQDDLRWYRASLEAGTSWGYTVDLNDHGDTGGYFVHAYVTEEGTRHGTSGIEAYVETFRKVKKPSSTAEVSTDCRTMQLTVKNANDYDQILLPIWSEKDGQDDIAWYAAEKQGDGTWTYTVDLANHNSTGAYQIHVYGKKAGELQMITSTTATVKKLAAFAVAEVSENCRTMKITTKNISGYDKVLFPVWSVINGQDDIVWYTAVRQADGNWRCSVDLTKHQSAGEYLIHVYGEKDGSLQMLTYTTAKVARAVRADELYATAEVSADCRTMKITAKNVSGYDKVLFPVWSVINGQDDIVWYTAVRQADGNWRCSVDLTEHQSAGEYLIHVYGEKDGSLQMLTYTTAEVERVARADELYATAEVSADCRTMKITAKNITGCDAVLFPTWSVENGQDDIVWYAAARQADGSWQCSVDLRKHHSAGEYQIHVYGRKNGELQMLTYTVANVDRAVS